MKTYEPKTTEWMRQNNWGAEAQRLVTDDLTSCEACLAEAERENSALRKVLVMKNNTSLANNLCPDHRDKQQGKPCLACEIERLQKFVKDIATNYDHEECYHRNGMAATCCRQCKAEQLLNSEGRAGT